MLSTTSNNPWTRFLQPIIDIIIHVEGKTFPCNKALLTQHSGYFRTVLSPTTTSLILPTVPAEYFTLLLASMSSTLEVNEGNVYQLLLYGQLLQMPAVVLQCKAYLANQALNVSAELMLPSSSRSVSNTVVRPVPNKLQNTTQQQPQLWKPWLYSATLYQDWISRLAVAGGTTDKTTSLPEEPGPSNNPQTSQETENSKDIKLQRPSKGHKKKLPLNLPDNMVEYDIEEGTASTLDTQSLLDIASCDGPVRFHRILNPTLMDTEDDDTNGELDVVSDDNTSCSIAADGSKMHDIIPNKTESNSGTIYKCVFCNHIFKSHYCYQKHKRRHLNPFTVDFTTENNPATASTMAQFQPKFPTVTATATATTVKDINVQFFPCKICGAKFPSYYFVHKHKKIWHPEAVVSTSQIASSTITSSSANNSDEDTKQPPL